MKQSFDTLIAAVRAKKLIKAKTGRKLSAYKCSCCGKFHSGRKR